MINSDWTTYGPNGSAKGIPSLLEAHDYCRRLARGHYENFPVASLLLPRDLRQHFYNVYAYCRWADDLADEVAVVAQDGVGGSPNQPGGRSDAGGSVSDRMALLDWWQRQLDACYLGEVKHPVFVALRATIQQFDLPSEPFCDLLVAFRQDQQPKRFQTFDELQTKYCRYSANPVGRIVLHLGRCHDADNARLSDLICTGLQLANFWQDVARDAVRSRIYLPIDVCREHSYGEADLEAGRYNEAFRGMMRGLVDRTDVILRRGWPLVDHVAAPLRIDVDLFVRCGLEILKAIRRIDYNVWKIRPVVSRRAKLTLLGRAWWRCRVARGEARHDE